MEDKDEDKEVKKQCRGMTLKGDRCKKLGFSIFCNFHKVSFNANVPEECAICLEDIKITDCALECGHIYHKSCIIKYDKDECPICRNNSDRLKKMKNNFILKERKVLTSLVSDDKLFSFIMEKNNWISNNDTYYFVNLILLFNFNSIQKIVSDYLMKNIYNINQISNNNLNELVEIITKKINNNVVVSSYSNLFIIE